MHSLKICSLNCNGFNSSKHELQTLCKEIDILCLQELWLDKDQLSDLNLINPKFKSFGVSPVDPKMHITVGRKYGGVGFLWKKELEHMITPINFDYDWMVGLELTNDDTKCTFINVYLPYQSYDNQDEYMNKLGKLQAVINELSTTSICILGDFNADISNSSLFSPQLKNFINESGLIVSDLDKLPISSFTHVSHAWSTTSWIDHCISSADMHDSIANLDIKYEYVSSDHKPLLIEIDIKHLPKYDFSQTNSIHSKINWNNLSQNNLATYTESSEYFLSRVKIPQNTVLCKSGKCTDKSHLDGINILYNDIIYALQQSSKVLLKSRNMDSKKYHYVPGWNEQVKESHTAAREAFHLWKLCGQPRTGALASLMRRSRANYKYALRFCRLKEDQYRAESLAKSLTSNNCNQFWKSVKKVNGNNIPLSGCIDGANGNANIAQMWKKHYESQFNSLKSKINAKSFPDCDIDVNCFINREELRACINSIKNGKSPGLDNITAEHLKFSSNRLIYLLEMCFNSMLTHSFLPAKMIQSVITPIIKDKLGKACDKSNYRPIALSTILSKVFEQLLLNRLTPYLVTTCNQFGFKEKHSTDMSIFLLKEIIRYYQSHGSAMFVCFMDASKAFDRIDHDLLFQKLSARNVPIYLIRILCYWYKNQLLCVKWGNNLSDFFNVNNGVRQGGILSPLLFNIYINDLSIKLNSQYIGCVFNTVIINHLIYADDIVLVAPSAKGLQILVNICYEYGLCYNITFNEKKTVYMVIRSNIFKNTLFPDLYIGINALKQVTKYKYLGHWICNDLKDNEDIVRQMQNIYAHGNQLIRNFKKCSQNIKVKLFQTFLSNMYTCELWCNYNKYQMSKLNVAYNNIFRILLNIPRGSSASEMFAIRNVCNFPILRRKNIYSLRQRLYNSKNTLVQNVLSSDLIFYSQLLKKWANLLYLF